MDAKTEILTRIRNAHQLSNMPTDVEIVRTYNTNKTEEYSREQLKAILIERLEDYKAIVHETSVKKLPQTIADVLKERGAKKVYAYCTHPIFSGPAIDRIANGTALDEVVVTNTIPLSGAATQCHKIRQLSVAPLFAQTMQRIARGESVMSLFLEQDGLF